MLRLSRSVRRVSVFKATRLYSQKCGDEVIKWADETKVVLDKSVKEKQFKIEFNEREWSDLVRRLKSTRYFDSMTTKVTPVTSYGFNSNYAKLLASYWSEQYDWKRQIDNLNKFPHYQIDVDGFKLHFYRVNATKSKSSKGIPVLMLNGWPGSFYEFYKAIDHINENFSNAERHFDIIVPSIPGYGYSIPLNKKIDVIGTARLFDALMRHLFGGDCKYFIHGEDWGALIGKMLTNMYPGRVNGLHITMTNPFDSFQGINLLKSILVTIFPSLLLTIEEIESKFQYGLFDRFKRMAKGSGYFHIQATRPETLGFGLADSPVGLLSYVLEKYALATVYPVGNGLEKVTKDELLTIVTLYWMTNTITSSMLYYKFNTDTYTSNDPYVSLLKKSPTPKQVPVAILSAPGEIDQTPFFILKDMFPNLKKYTLLKHGSHFSAFYEPKIVSNHFIDFVNSINKQKSGSI